MTFDLFSFLQACETNTIGQIDTIGVQQTAQFVNDDGLVLGYQAGSGILV